MWPAVELRELQVFLTVAEELHFGRAAERLAINPSRVSQVIRELEAKLGGQLFDRTSRRVQFTPFGERVHGLVEPAFDALQHAILAARQDAQSIAGPMRVSFTTTTEGPVLSRLIKEFEDRYPSCAVTLHEVDAFDPYSSLRRGETDVLVHYLPIDEPDLTEGPALAHYDVVLYVARGHRLAEQSVVSVEDLADEELARVPPSFPKAMHDSFLPALTPSGRPIRRTQPARTIKEILSLVAQGRIVWPGISTTMEAARTDIVSIPVGDFSPVALGLIWRTAIEDARIDAMAEVARGLS